MSSRPITRAAVVQGRGYILPSYVLRTEGPKHCGWTVCLPRQKRRYFADIGRPDEAFRAAVAYRDRHLKEESRLFHLHTFERIDKEWPTGTPGVYIVRETRRRDGGLKAFTVRACAGRKAQRSWYVALDAPPERIEAIIAQARAWREEQLAQQRTWLTVAA